jgi:CBS domain-containing protein
MTLHMAWTITGTVDDIYRPGAIIAAADDNLEQTAARLEDKDISALVIMDGDRLAGIITERDIVRAVADRRDLADATAGEYMTSTPATVEWTPRWQTSPAPCWPTVSATCRWWWPAR